MVYPLVVLLTISSCDYSCCSCAPAPQTPLPVSFVACSGWINVVLLCSCSSGAALGDYPCVWVASRTAPAAALCSVILWLAAAAAVALVLLLQSTNITDVHLPLLMLSSSSYESDAMPQIDHLVKGPQLAVGALRSLVSPCFNCSHRGLVVNEDQSDANLVSNPSALWLRTSAVRIFSSLITFSLVSIPGRPRSLQNGNHCSL